jgi:hypothetical protein
MPRAASAPIPISLTREKIELLLEALDSHVYWQLTPPEHRRDGFSTASNDAVKNEDDEARENRLGRIASEALQAELRDAIKSPRKAVRRPRRKHSRDGQLRCDLCAPLRCRKAP